MDRPHVKHWEVDEYSGSSCSKCGSDAGWEECWQCGGECGHDEHEWDPVNYGPGELFVECEECKGVGGWHVCPTCGWLLPEPKDTEVSGVPPTPKKAVSICAGDSL